ncbi:MAG: AraC family transcriptional regulator [Rubrivivax sp.]
MRRGISNTPSPPSCTQGRSASGAAPRRRSNWSASSRPPSVHQRGEIAGRQRLAPLVELEVALAELQAHEAGLRDPLVAGVLARLHGAPAQAWTLPRLAAAVGASRTVLADRFVRLVGQPPMHYLTAWRMQLAARLLAERSATVQSVAGAVGYTSEAAFSRAFKRHTGKPPSAWRNG